MDSAADEHQHPAESENSPGPPPVQQQSGPRASTAKTSRCYHFIQFLLFLAAQLASIASIVLFSVLAIDNSGSIESTLSKCVIFADLGVWSCSFFFFGQIVLILFIALILIFYLALVIVKARTRVPFHCVGVLGGACLTSLSLATTTVSWIGLYKTCPMNIQGSRTTPDPTPNPTACALVNVSVYISLAVAVFFLVQFIWNLIILSCYGIRNECCRPRKEHVVYGSRPTTPLLHTGQKSYSTVRGNPFHNDSHP